MVLHLIWRKQILCCLHSELLVIRAHLLQDFTSLLLITRSLPSLDGKVESGLAKEKYIKIGRKSNRKKGCRINFASTLCCYLKSPGCPGTFCTACP